MSGVSGGYSGLLCPACGQPIRGEVAPDAIVRCEGCSGAFVLRRRGQRTSSRGMPVVASGGDEQMLDATQPAPTGSGRAGGSNPRLTPAPGVARGSNPRLTPAAGARLSSRRGPKISGRMKTLPADDPGPIDDSGIDDEEGRETRSYSKQQIIAAAYDRPERVPLGPAPAVISFNLLYAACWGLLGVALLAAIWRFKTAEPFLLLWPRVGKSSAELALTPSLYFVGAVLQSLNHILAAVLAIIGVACIERCDARARWIAWRSAAAEHALDAPPGSSLPLMLPPMLGGALLVAGGLLSQLSSSGVEVVGLLGGGGVVTFIGLSLLLCGLGAGDLRGFLWRTGQSGRALPLRKRGDEIGLVSPVRVQALERSNSALLILLALAFFAAACATMLASGRAHAKGGGGLALWLLGAGAAAGIAGGAFVLHRMALLWNELAHGWEVGGRSIGKARVNFGERSSRAFRIAAFSLCAAIAALAVPVVKTIGGSSVPAMLLSICLPAAVGLFFVWMAATKMDSCRVAAATAATAGSRALEAASRPLSAVLAATACGLAGAEFLWQLYVMYLQQQMIHASASGQLAVHLLESVLWAGMSALPACWVALMVLDFDRAAANLETCRELE